MDALPLAYTPHPAAARPAVTPMQADAPQRERGGTGLALLAGAAMTVIGTAALSSVLPAGAQVSPIAPVSVEQVAQPRAVFEARTVETPRPAAEPAPVELRAASPLPVAGAELATNSAADAMNAPQALQKTQQFRSLTSFDGTMEMTSGSNQGQQAQPQQMVAEARYVAPPPVVWNHPIQWIQTNDLGGGYSGGQIR